MIKSILSLLIAVAASTAVAGPLDQKKAERHLNAVAAGDVEALMTDYADDAYMDWIGGPLDGRYYGKAAIREVWKKFVAANDGQPRPARVGQLSSYGNPKGVALEAEAEYGGKTPLKVWHVLVFRDGVMTSELWQIDPNLKVGD